MRDTGPLVPDAAVGAAVDVYEKCIALPALTEYEQPVPCALCGEPLKKAGQKWAHADGIARSHGAHVWASEHKPGQQAALTAIYDWLATVVAFPFDFTFGDKPPWLDMRMLAEAWHRHEPAEDVDTWLCAVLDETGWDE